MSPPTKILQIVPRLPPDNDGVGDYARQLARQLASAHHIETAFLSFRPNLETPNTIDGFATHQLFNHTKSHFLSLLPKDIDGILLHYSNYPYLQSHFKAPFWFPNALKVAKTERNLPVVVLFHELPTLKWKNIRVLNPIQTPVSKELSRLANAVVTDTQNFKRQLQKWTKSAIACIPDFSTIGEPQQNQIQPLEKRQPRLVIFGGSDRARAYQNLGRLFKTCQALGIQEICDIGTKQNIAPSRLGKITFTELGFQPATKVQEILLDSQAGFLDYTKFPGDLGKSSVFAAFCAHGVMPICTAHNPSEADGIFANQQYAIAGEHLSNWSPQQRQSIADRAREWYAQHNLEANAKLFSDCFS